jgi:hypothetical protein
MAIAITYPGTVEPVTNQFWLIFVLLLSQTSDPRNCNTLECKGCRSLIPDDGEEGKLLHLASTLF